MHKTIEIILHHGEDVLQFNLRYGVTVRELISQAKEQYGVYLCNVYNVHDKKLPYGMPLRGSVTFRAE